MRDEDNDIIDSALASLAYQSKCIDAQVLVIAELREELKTVREQERARIAEWLLSYGERQTADSIKRADYEKEKGK
jgi:hypothetical protein